MPKRRANGEGNIRKRKDGRWQGQYVSGYNPETGKPRRHTIYGQTQKEVAEKLRAATSSIDNGTFQEPRKITVAEYAAEYMTTHVATLTDSTQRSYEKNLRLHILPELGTRRLTDLTHREVQRFASSLSAGGKGLAPKTVHTVFGTLHALLTAAQRDEILQRNVADFCSLPRVTQTRAKAITSAELNQFLDLIRKDEFYYLFFLDIFPESIRTKQKCLSQLFWHRFAHLIFWFIPFHSHYPYQTVSVWMVTNLFLINFSCCY